MKKFHILLALLLVLVSCGGADLYSHDAVRRAAQDYYTLLLQGQYDQFVSGIADADSMPEQYRSQLVDMAAQFAHGQMTREEGSLVRVAAVADSLCPDSTAFVYLELVYADSLRERVQVPMVLQGDTWRMR